MCLQQQQTDTQILLFCTAAQTSQRKHINLKTLGVMNMLKMLPEQNGCPFLKCEMASTETKQ